MRLSEKLEQVEALGFSRDMFPYRYGEHELQILHNDVYYTEEGRVFVHISLYCFNCERSERIRGNVWPEEPIAQRIQTAKLKVLGYYVVNECQ